MKNKIVLIVALLVAATCLSKAQTTNTNPPASFYDRTIHALDVPAGAVADVGVFAAYAPSLSKHWQQNVGGGLFASYLPSPDALIGAQLRGEYLNISKYEGTVWLPNGMVTLQKGFNAGSIRITPSFEGGMAVDSKIHPYGIIGAALSVGWHGFAGTLAAERWSGPMNGFTVYNLLLTYRLHF